MIRFRATTTPAGYRRSRPRPGHLTVARERTGPAYEPTAEAGADGEVTGEGSGDVRGAGDPRGDAASDADREDVDPVAGAVATILATVCPQPRFDGELADLVATLRAADRLLARAVALAGQVDGPRAAVEEGMTVDAAVRLHSGAAPADVATVLTAGQVLGQMPAVAGLFASGVLSWGHIRAVTAGARRLDAGTRTALDGSLGAQAEQLSRLDPDRQLWAIDDVIDQHRPERTVEARAERRTETEFLALQGRLDGSGSVYGEFDPESFATLTTHLEAEADAPRARPCPGDEDGPDEAVPTRAQQLAAGLLRLCTRPAGGAGGSGPARVTVVVDLDRLTETAAGELTTAVRGRPPRIVRRALDRLTCDGALDLVVRNGTDLLAAERDAPDITAAVRRAVHVRDGGCRFPGCTAPVTWCDIHHVTERARGGDHSLANLVALCRRHHTAIHRGGWHQTLRSDGTYTVRRRGRTWTTRPRRDRRLAPPNEPPDDDRPAPAPARRPRRPGRSGATDPPDPPDPPPVAASADPPPPRAGPTDGFPF